MKKALSLLVSASLGLSVLCGSGISASGEKAQSNKNFVIFGDSIAAGYGLSSDEYNYGQICADYYSSSVSNYAVSGHTTDDLLAVLDSLNDQQKKTIADSGIVVISIGGNDILHYASKYLINYAAKKGMLKSGYTLADIPEDPGISDLNKYVNLDGKGGLIEYAQSNTSAAADLLAELKILAANLRFNTGDYEGIIANKTIPNIQTAVKKIKAVNPNARIIVQTIYQPVQLDQAYVVSKFGSGSNYSMVLNQIRTNFRAVMEAFRDELKKVDGIEIADVYYSFTSVADGVSQNEKNPGHASYFTDIKEPGNERDFHPNQKGHLAIASDIINTVGDLHDDNGKLSKIFKGLADRADYPAIALDIYKTAAGNIKKGDVNFDDIIDARDAAIVLREYTIMASGGASSLSEIQLDCADADGSKSINAVDSRAILKFYAASLAGKDCKIEDFKN